eukprot:TRINITY_DN17167_c0_g1_i1.p1 TRINITY_DN17167_c0_g1~~TRINITY_DN17167_c0_g1_i1.p1  ORF type:complete len:856 (+),score=143.49 TRINITY_DN17167_c0_g1_i1:138-2705(+)
MPPPQPDASFSSANRFGATGSSSWGNDGPSASPSSPQRLKTQVTILGGSNEVLHGQPIEVECLLSGKDLAPSSPKDKVDAYLVAIDVGAMNFKGIIRPQEAIKSKPVASRYLCHEPVMLQKRQSQLVALTLLPEYVLHHQSCVALQIVTQSSVSGKDQWMCISSVPAVVMVVQESESERSLLHNLNILSQHVIGLLEYLRFGDFLPEAGRANAIDKLHMCLEDCRDLVSQSGGSDLWSPAMRLKIDALDYWWPRELEGITVSSRTGGGCPNPKGYEPQNILRSPDYTTEDCAAMQLWQALVPIVGNVHIVLQELGRAGDTQWIKNTWEPFTQIVGSVQQTDPPEDDRVDIFTDHGLRPGDEILIGGEFHRVKALGSIKTCYSVTWSDESSQDLKRFSVGPLVPAAKANEGKTMNFVENVEDYDESQHEQRLRNFLNEMNITLLPGKEDCDGSEHEETLQTLLRQRKEQIINLYTRDVLYQAVNASMYNDIANDLKYYAPYIRELRDIFLFGQTEPRIVEPFKGEVTRRMNLKDDQIEEYISKVGKRDQEVYWSAFTSTSCGGGNEGFGSVLFKIRCDYEPDKIKNEHYFAASIKTYSAFPTENEVLLPPHSSFLVAQVEKVYGGEIRAIIEMTSSNLPSVWHLCETHQWEEFEQWAKSNPDMVGTHGKQFSIINAVAKNIVNEPAPGVSHPLGICIKYGANVNEIDPETGDTPLALLAQNHKEQLENGQAGLAKSIDKLLGQGANPHLHGPEMPSLLDILPDQDLSASKPAKAHWFYWVDDGVDGKATDWYHFAPDATGKVEDQFQHWLSAGKDFSKIMSIPSGSFSYDIDFRVMRQTNTTTRKERKIQRGIGEF